MVAPQVPGAGRLAPVPAEVPVTVPHILRAAVRRLADVLVEALPIAAITVATPPQVPTEVRPVGLAPGTVLEVAEAGRVAPEAGSLVAATRVARAAITVATVVRVVATGVDAVATAVALRRRPGATTPCPATAASLVAAAPLGRKPADVLVRRAMEDVGRPAKEADVASPAFPLQAPGAVIPAMEGQEAIAVPTAGVTLAPETVRVAPAAHAARVAAGVPPEVA